MESKFKNLRNDIDLIVNNSSLVSRSFETSLFKKAPWFLANLDLRKKTSKELKQTNLLDEKKNIQTQKVNSNVLDQKIVSNIQNENELGQLTDNIKKCSECKKFVEDIQTNPLVQDQFDVRERGIEILFIADTPKLVGDDVITTFTPDNGEIMKKIISVMNLKKGSYHLTYAVKCFKKDCDVAELRKMANKCVDYLHKEIHYLRPKVVVGFGAFVSSIILQKREKMQSIHGKFSKQTIKFDESMSTTFQFVPITHPDFLLINSNMKRTAWEDLKKVMAYLKE